jgi:hypothetical protein
MWFTKLVFSQKPMNGIRFCENFFDGDRLGGDSVAPA